MSKFKKAFQGSDVAPFEDEDFENAITFGGDPLRFAVEALGGLKVEIDLTRYRDGDSESLIMGFPVLIMDLLPVVRSHMGRHQRSKKAIQEWSGKGLSPLFKAITQMKRLAGTAPESADEFQDADGLLIKDFLMQLGGEPQTRKHQYAAIFSLLQKARSESAPPLRWPSFDIAPEIEVHRDVDPRAVKAMYHTCKRVVEEAEVRFKKGRILLSQGIDPRDTGTRRLFKQGLRGPSVNNVWHSQANLTVLLRHVIKDRILGLGEIKQKLITSIHNTTNKTGIPHSALVGANVPSSLEVAASVMMVSMETGWIDTVWGIDLKEEWYSLRRGASTEQLAKTDSVVLQATRPKTSIRQRAIGAAGSKFRSFQLIMDLLERTEFLRECLRERRQLLEKKKPDRQVRAEIVEIDIRLRSPWLYYTGKGTGATAVGLGKAGTIGSNLETLKAKTIETLSPDRGHDESLVTAINALRWSDMRDAFATHIYDASFGNIFLVKRALGHREVATTRIYLRQKRQLRERFSLVSKLTNVILTEVGANWTIDPTILHMRVNDPNFSEADRERLFFRTRLGMGCANPRAPDKDLAPNHVEGTDCFVQRCILCRQGFIFSDAYADLADRHADLIWLRKKTLPDRWLTSNLSWELEAIEKARDNIFHASINQFNLRSEQRLADIDAGRAYVFDDPGLTGKLQ